MNREVFGNIAFSFGGVLAFIVSDPVLKFLSAISLVLAIVNYILSIYEKRNKINSDRDRREPKQ